MTQIQFHSGDQTTGDWWYQSPTWPFYAQPANPDGEAWWQAYLAALTGIYASTSRADRHLDGSAVVYGESASKAADEALRRRHARSSQ